MQERYDVVVIGSGFGGAITACRLAQAGRSVCVLERGRRWGKAEFPRTIGQLRHAFWNDRDRGFLDYRSFQTIDVLQASGVGGGSLVYFNVQVEAPERTFQHGWPTEVSRQVLNPYYGLVQDMLDAVPRTLGFGRSTPLGGVAPELLQGNLTTRFLPYLGVGTDAADGQIRLRRGRVDTAWNVRRSRAMFRRMEDAMKALSRGIGGKY
jgi:choline dehydrogenase-like flavoprotein